MKRYLILLAAMCLLVCGLVGCGEKTPDTQQENISADANVNTDVDNEADEPARWETFLDEYEDFVDDYVDFMKRYQENPTDLSLISEAADMATEVTEWAEEAEDIEEELAADTEALKEYTKRLANIVAKLSAAL